MLYSFQNKRPHLGNTVSCDGIGGIGAIVTLYAAMAGKDHHRKHLALKSDIERTTFWQSIIHIPQEFCFGRGPIQSSGIDVFVIVIRHSPEIGDLLFSRVPGAIQLCNVMLCGPRPVVSSPFSFWETADNGCGMESKWTRQQGQSYMRRRCSYFADFPRNNNMLYVR